MSWFSDGLARMIDTLTDAAGEAVTLSRGKIAGTETTAIAADSGDECHTLD